MLFHYRRVDDAFLRAVRAAIAAHRPLTLRDLLATHGERAFARALATLSARARDDALSMLTPDQRTHLRTVRPGLSLSERPAQSTTHNPLRGASHA